MRIFWQISGRTQAKEPPRHMTWSMYRHINADINAGLCCNAWQLVEPPCAGSSRSECMPGPEPVLNSGLSRRLTQA
jgi:hypothetical protein